MGCGCWGRGQPVNQLCTASLQWFHPALSKDFQEARPETELECRLIKNLQIQMRHFWLETSRLSDIFPAKMDLFWISPELQLRGLQSWWAKCRSLHIKERTLLQREESREGYNKQSPWVFTGRVLARKEEPFFFLLGSSVTTGLEVFPFSSPSSLSLWFLIINFLLSCNHDLSGSMWKLNE